MEEWVAQYAKSHQNPINRFCHTIGIPLIAVSIPLLVAAVWVRPEVPFEERTRLAAKRVDEINHELARYETIKRHFVADLPLTVEDGTLTSSLKLRRKIVYDRLRDRFEALYS